MVRYREPLIIVTNEVSTHSFFQLPFLLGQTNIASKLVSQQKPDQIDVNTSITSSVGTIQSSNSWQNVNKTPADDVNRKTSTTEGRIADREDRGLSGRNLLLVS